MEFDSVDAPRLSRRFPPDLRLRTYIIGPIFAFILYVPLFITGQLDATLFAIFLICLFFLANHGIDWGYQLAFDKDRVYQRPKGWRWSFRRKPWYSIRFEDMARMQTIFGADAGRKRNFMPFEFILVYGKSGYQRDNIVIYPPAFKDRAVKDFLLLLYEKRPEIFTDDVVEYMNSPNPL